MAAETKEQGQPEAAHAERVDPATRRPDSAAALREVQREVQQLQERVDELTQSAVPAPPAAPPPIFSDPDRGAPAPAQHPLQDILPQINDLAQRVGGMKELAQIVVTLAQTKE